MVGSGQGERLAADTETRTFEREHLLLIVGTALFVIHIFDVAFVADQSFSSGIVEYILTLVNVLIIVFYTRIDPRLVVGVALVFGVIYTGGGIDHIYTWIDSGADAGDKTGIIEIVGGLLLISAGVMLLLRWRRARAALPAGATRS
jgi:hypothetical protein